MQRLAIGISAVVLAFLMCPAYAASEDAIPFTLSSSPDDVILKITSPGGGLRAAGVLSGDCTLYGDGRFVATSRTTSRVMTKEVLLSYLEMHDLVGILVEGNLLNWLDEDMTRRFEEQMGGVPQQRGFGGMRIHVSLESYDDAEPLTKDLLYSINLSVLPLTHPDKPILPEIHAFEAFRKQIEVYFPKENATDE